MNAPPIKIKGGERIKIPFSLIFDYFLLYTVVFLPFSPFLLLSWCGHNYPSIVTGIYQMCLAASPEYRYLGGGCLFMVTFKGKK